MNDMSNNPRKDRPAGDDDRFGKGEDPGGGTGGQMNWRAFIDRGRWEMYMYLKSLKWPVVCALLGLIYIDILTVGNHASFWADFFPTRSSNSLGDIPIVGWMLPDRNPYEIAAFTAGLMTVVLPATLWYLVFSRARYGSWRHIFLDRNTALLFAICLIGYLVLTYFEFGIFADAIAAKKPGLGSLVVGHAPPTVTKDEAQIIAAGLVAVNALLASLTGFLFSRIKS